MEWLCLVEKELGVNILKGDIEGIGEVFIMGLNKWKIYFDGYDFLKMCVFEFYGCKYYNCRKCFFIFDIDVFIKIIECECYILGLGYKFFRIWEYEYKLFK